MMQTLVNDTVNDIAIIETSFCFNVRYSLQVTKHGTLKEAVENFGHCLEHAMGSQGYCDGEET